MITKNIGNILISIIAILVVLVLIGRYSCNGDKEIDADITKLQKEHAAAKVEFEDTLNFLRGQTDLQAAANLAHVERIRALEHDIDSLIKKHKVTKTKIKPLKLPPEFYNTDTGFVLAPNEYVNECEACFDALDKYKKESIQLRFERDSYDTLMRRQIDLHSNRITELEHEKKQADTAYRIALKLAEPTRKLKLSAMGMLNDLFTPNGGGPGLIYEDKKSNEFGGHVLFTSRGNIYLLHLAKTISFKRKK